MKVEIDSSGRIVITAENPTEAFALKYLTPVGQDHICSKCGQMKVPIMVDCAVLDQPGAGPSYP